MPTPIKLYENGRVQVNGEIIEFPPELKGGRNLVLDSDKFIQSSSSATNIFQFHKDLRTLIRGRRVTTSVYIEYTNKTGGGRIGFEPCLNFTDGTKLYLELWEFPPDGSSFSGVISKTFDIPDKEISWISQGGIYIQQTATMSKVGRPKLEISDSPTPWSHAPEDLGLSIPNNVINFSNASFNEKGVLSGGLVEVPSELYSNPNLLLQSNVYISSGGAYLVNIYDMIEEWLLNITYTVTIKGKLNDGQKFGIWANGAGTNVGYAEHIGNDIHVAKVRASSILTNGAPKTLRVYNYPGTSAISAEIEWIKLEKGDVSTAYSKASVEYDGTSNEGTNNSMVVGRNLVQKSNSFNLGSTEASSGITRLITPEGYLKVVTVAGNKNWLSGWYKSVANIEESLSEGDVFTVSVTMKSDDSTIKPTLYLKTGIGYFSLTGDIGPEFSTIYYTGVWKDANTLAPHFGWTGTAGTYYIKNWKIEKGGQPTIWTPAPEDLGLNIPSWVSTFGNPISMSSEGISVSDELSEYPNIVTDGLKLWYDFKGMVNDSREKEVAYDLSGNGNNGFLTNFDYNASSGYNNGLLFDGTNDRIVTNYTPPMVFTIEVTIKPTGGKHGHIVSTYGPSGTSNLLVQITASGIPEIYIGSASRSIGGTFMDTVSVITVSFDGSTMRVYKNGELYTSISTTLNEMGYLMLGDRDNFTRAYLGYIYSFKMYDKVLTSDQIKYNYEVEKGRWN